MTSLCQSLLFVDIPAKCMRTLGFLTVSGSAFPIITSLDLANIFKNLSSMILIRQNQFLELSDLFSHFAVKLLRGLPSSYMVMIVLEVQICDVAVSIDNLANIDCMAGTRSIGSKCVGCGPFNTKLDIRLRLASTINHQFDLGNSNDSAPTQLEKIFQLDRET